MSFRATKIYIVKTLFRTGFPHLSIVVSFRKFIFRNKMHLLQKTKIKYIYYIVDFFYYCLFILFFIFSFDYTIWSTRQQTTFVYSNGIAEYYRIEYIYEHF